ncbi:hypothetical protein Tco_0479352 [Tanacetum coccineum]
MGYEGDLNALTFNKALFSPQWKFLFHTMNHCISSKSTSWDQIPTNFATASAPSPIPSPSIDVPDPEGSSGNHRGESSNDASLSGNEDGQEAKESSQTTYHTSQSLDEHKISKEDFSEEKGGYTRNPTFDDIDDFVDVDDTLDYMESEDAQDEGRISSVVLEEKENADKEISTEAPVSTVKPNKGTNKKNEGTDKQDGSTNSTKVSTDRQGESTADQNEGKSVTQTAPTSTSTSTPTTPTPTVFGDDETIAQVLIIMSQNKEKLKEKEKGVEIRNIEDTKRLRPTSTRSILTFRPLPKIDPKDKGKKRIEEEDESDTESEEITEAEKKFKRLANDEKVARKARINADKILAEELQKEEREKFTIEQRAKFLHDTIAAQRKFLAQQRSEAIRNKPPTRNQLRNQMMTYLKHVGGKKHSDLKTKTFEEIQVLYERLKRQDQNFVAIGSAKDERQIKELNKDPKKKRVIKETPREEDTTRHSKDDDSDDEHRKCLRIITFESTIDSEIMETKSFIARLHKVSSPDGNYLVVYRVNGHFRAFNYLMEGDLKIMMESSTEENDQGDFWNNQQEWEIVRWRLYEACRVCILELKDGTVIYMLVERRVLNSPCFTVKSWLVQDQTVPGKD